MSAPEQMLVPKARARPIVKWAGGKSRLLPELVARLPSTCGRYYEPFAGGAALYLHLEPERALVTDTNADLVNVYQQVAHAADAVIEKLVGFAGAHNADFYKRARAWWNTNNDDRNTVFRAALFLYFNKTSFNGVWRVNRRGAFNVPLGDYDDPKIVNADELRAASPVLGRASLVTCDYRTAVASATAGDFIYFDPPYHASFTGYTADGFGEAEHRELAATFRSLVGRDVQVMLSSADTPLAWELYAAHRIDRVRRRGTINSDRTRRHPVGELIITSDYARRADAIAVANVGSMFAA